MQIFFRHPLIAFQTVEIIGQTELVEVGMDDPMREHMADTFPQGTEIYAFANFGFAFTNFIFAFTNFQNALKFLPKRTFVFRKVFFRLNQQRLVEVLPDVVTRPLPDEGMATRTLSCAKARQLSANGQCVQSGEAGVHCKAPKSIIA